MIDKVKNFIKEYKSELCLGSIMFIGFGLLNMKINNNQIQNLDNHIDSLDHTNKLYTLLSNTQNHVNTLMKESD